MEGEVIGDPAKAQVMSVPLSFFHFSRLLFVFLTDIDCPTSISNFFGRKEWLEKKGSPGSKIDKAVFSEFEDVQGAKIPDFDIRY